MKRAWIAVFFVLLFLAAPNLEAASKKRLLVYLDVSGSMYPDGDTTTRGGTRILSPFRQTVEILQALLQEPGFIQQDDMLEIVLFGEAPQSLPAAQGPQAMSSLLQSLRGKGWRSFIGGDRSSLFFKLSDFTPVFQSMEDKVAGSQDFDRQVVILASDFVHQANLNGRYIEAWNGLVGQWQPRLAALFKGEDKKIRLLLFQAPPVAKPENTTETGTEIQNHVVGSLQPEIVSKDQILIVGQPGLDLKDYARKVRAKLLSPPRVQAGRDPANHDNILIAVENPNSYRLNLKQVNLRCAGPDPLGDGDTVSYTSEIPVDKRLLETTGQPNSIQKVPLPLPIGSCWAEPVEFDAAVETQEGVTGKSKGTTGTWFQYRPLHAFSEDQVFLGEKLLRVELAMKGVYIQEDKTFEARITGEGGSPTIAVGRFKAPASLASEEEKHYRIIFSVRGGKRDEVGKGARIQLEIDEAQADGNLLIMEEDKLQSVTNFLQGGIGWLGVLAAIFVVFWKRRSATRRGKGLLSFLGHWTVVSPFFVGFFNLVLSYLRDFLLEIWPLSLANAIKFFGVFVLGFIIFFAFLYVLRQDSLEGDIVQRKVKDFEQYRARATSGWKTWALAATAAASLAIGTFLWVPPQERATPVIGEVETIELIEE